MNDNMVYFLAAISNKYRIYLMVNVGVGQKAEKLSEVVQPLVDRNIIKGKHRIMYSSSVVGHIA